MACAPALGLLDDSGLRGDLGGHFAHRVRTVAHHEYDGLRVQIPARRDGVGKERQATHFVQNLRSVRFHPRAFARGEYHELGSHECSFPFLQARFRPWARCRKWARITEGVARLQGRARSGQLRTVIFDLDGTLADTSRDLIAAANRCFEDLGHGTILDPLSDARTAFNGGRAMLRLGFARLGQKEDAVIERQFDRFLEHYEAAIDTHTRLYPGAADAIEKLREAGYAVGICTNKPERLADILMTRLGVRSLFQGLVGADTLPVRKPDPAPYREAVLRTGGDLSRSLLIGDTETDRETARAAGVPSVLVTFGPDGDGVSALSPEALLPDYAALQDVVSRLNRLSDRRREGAKAYLAKLEHRIRQCVRPCAAQQGARKSIELRPELGIRWRCFGVPQRPVPIRVVARARLSA